MDARQAVQRALKSSSIRVQATDDEVDIDLQELQVADYIVFLLALETYMGWLEETVGSIPLDNAILRKGIGLARLAERQNLAAIGAFIKSNLVSKSSVTLLEAAIRPPPTPAGLAIRATKLRTVLSKGGTATTKAVFGSSTKARREVQVAIDASMIDDPDEALNKFSALTLRNKKLEKWIDEASDAVPGDVIVNPIQEATKGTTEASTALLNAQVQQDAKPGTDQSIESRTKHADTLAEVEAQATEVAKKALARSDEEDRPLTRSEVIGVATATATAVTSDPSKPQNIPVALQGIANDPEQLAAALTGGKVRVSAGAGSGKSTTLLARTQYLVDQGGDPNRMMAMSFNKKAADELAVKMAAKIGSNRVSTSKNPNPNGVLVGTMHSTFLNLINQFGTPAQVNIFAKVPKDPKDPRSPKVGGMVNAGSITKAVKAIWEECFANIDKDPVGDPNGSPRTVPADELWKMPPKSKRMTAYMNVFQGDGMSLEQAQAWAAERGTIEADQAAKFFEVYEGLKGGLGVGWRPTFCGDKPSPTFNKFVDFNRGGKPRVGDFNDMLTVFRDIMRENPAAKQKVQGQIDHIMVDECQDLNPLQFEVLQHMTGHIETDDPKRSFWMVGDDKQCVSVDTLVSVPGGVKRAADLAPGDHVLAFRNGENVEQTVRYVVPSSWTWGYRITTEGGKSLLMSPNHKLWATSPVLEEDNMIVYLMYRKDMGFRVGVTNHCEDESNPFGRRTLSERAERLWVLDLATSRDEALYLEESYSLRYGIPTMVFEGTNRGLNQERITRVFQAFGMNGAKLLEERHLSFDLPNWMAYSNSKGKADRRTIQLIMHAAKGSQVALEWSGDDFNAALEGVRYENLEGGRHRLRRFFNNYREALTFAEDIKKKMGANLRKRLATPEGPMSMLTASALVCSMSVPVRSGDTVVHERIMTIEKVDGAFVDLDVDDASNFFGGDILSSNCIYQFRGAEPNNFIKLDKMGFKDRQITTNYRCAPEFIDAANKLIANNSNQIPMEAKPRPGRARGEANLTVVTPRDPAEAAAMFGQKILASSGEALSNFAVLARTNGELGVYQQVCATVGIPFVQKKASSVFSSQETESFRAFLQAVMSKDPKVLQASFGQALLSGGLHTIKAGGADRPDAIKAFNGQIKKSIATYCQKNRRPLADFDPFNEANANPDFLAAVLQEVSGRQEWAAKKDAENGAPLMEGISLLREHMAESAGKKDDTGNPEFSTKQLFEAVLELPVYEVKPPAPGSNQWIRRHTTLRKSTEERLAARNAQEDADTDVELEDTEKAHLGTLDFVQLMMEPSAVDPSYNPLDPDQFHARFEGLADRAEELRIDPDEWEKKQDNAGVRLADRKPPPGVYLGTIHSTKGAEWEDVTLLMPKGIFPLQKKPRKPKDNEVPEEPIYDAESELESERRLGYVALTRPKKSLTIMSTGGISPFVAEAGLHVGQNVPRPETETPNAVPATPGEADKAMADEAASEGPPEEDHPDEEEHPSPLSHNASHSESRDSFKSFINRLAKANVKYTYHRGDS